MGAAHVGSNEGVVGPPTAAQTTLPAANIQSTDGGMLALLESLSPSSGNAAHGPSILATPHRLDVGMTDEAAANT